MEPFIDDAAQLRAAATKADALARRSQRAADEAFRVFLRDDGAASPDQAVDAARASARAAQEAWRKYVQHVSKYGTGGAPAARHESSDPRRAAAP